MPDENATLAIGAELAGVLHGGVVIFLQGDLGAGKTTLTRGLLRALGYAGRVKSPTYTLVEPYAVSNLNLYHFDLYRFQDPMEWVDAGFRDYFNEQSICVIEWADQARGLLPAPDLMVTLTPHHDGRNIEIQALTETGSACLEQLATPS
ncbi:bifunctional tRNA (adenosine(37)-N6)-threonylcarbamoyltransferase complex ATPase subunit type 1 TsaE/phosphotransferase [Silvimonas sp. JCM 19000]